MMFIMDKRLNDHGKNWRHVYKTLILLEYMVCCGSELVVNYARDRLYMINTLKEFRHMDQQGYDQGANVRAKSRDLVELLSDEEMLSQARATRSIPQLHRTRSQEPLTLNHHPQTQSLALPAAPQARQSSSYDDLQQMDEDVALAIALRESQEMHEKEEGRRRGKRDVDPAKVYENFMDNVSNASLARSSSSGTKLATKDGSAKNGQRASVPAVDSLLDLDDEAFGEALEGNGLARQQRSQSLAAQDLSALYSLNLGQQQATANPFVISYESERNPFGGGVPMEDPFSALHSSTAPGPEVRAYSLPELSVPMPNVPGQAPINHMSVAGGNVGAKPVLPHQMAPQFGYQSQQNQQQGGAKHPEDPFAQF